MGAQQEAKPQVPQLDPAIQTLSDSQTKAAEEFQKGSGDLKQQQGNIAQQSSNQQLAGTKKDITKGSNSRGLLYSGLNQAAQAGAQGQAAQKQADTQTGINQSVDQQSQDLNKAAQQSQFGVQNIQNQRLALAYNLAKNK